MRRGKSSGPAPAPESRQPHPDGRVEGQLQHVLSLYRAIARTEQRMADITSEQRVLDRKTRDYAATYDVSNFTDQAAQLRAERTALEEFIARQHESAAKILTDLGDGAVYLGPVP